jgi:hypothetical protein
MMTVEERETGDRHLVGGPLIDAKTTFNFANKRRGQPEGWCIRGRPSSTLSIWWKM